MKDYDLDSPELEFKRGDGSVIRFYRHKTDRHKFRAFIDGKPYNPTGSFEDAIEKGLIKKK